MNMHTTTGVQAPVPPKSLKDTGLSIVMMRDILLKTIFRKNLEHVSQMAEAICLSMPLTQQLVEITREQKLIEAQGTLHAGSGSEMAFQLSDAGKSRALDALSQSEYYGALPVPLEMYKEQVKRQSVRNIQITRDKLLGSMGHLILPEHLLNDLGPAVSSGRSILLYGPPGNGKSAISNGIRDALGDMIYIPQCIEYAGQVVTLYDPIVHTLIEDDAVQVSSLRRTDNRYDKRYLMCERPTVMTGGELMLNMLDLNYNATSRTYQASLQLKSTGGVFIVDDLGRQEEPPQALINRWIVPMEAEYDILALQSGEKFEVPFDTLVIFSTNFHPNEMFDGAALRRIFFKIKIDGPTQEEFLKVFAMVAKKKKMPLNEAALIHLLKVKYPTIDNVYANYHANFLIDQMIAVCEYEGIPYQMTPELIDRAWANMYVKDEEIKH
ncbi:ATPase with chaperone activity, associated with Flp pilus assembly [Litoreibacter arenae]|uniref:Putative ATPase with chaperone activity, associated with Flp pilus assembly n=1 Tax=Litoreibacter arenae DSM 19593 TaxID=1123360 RepID=S9RRV1_9RHOB|nr:ATPase with chaperone activity, associated with Flp pilus assembly [Litoreibacter arenae]EPX80780.1 putative ATPase with chaperone activity, associated with Flp pilus assembly [Litoreibacter arenae DSM 19593]